jgi:hypothetical protein
VESYNPLVACVLEVAEAKLGIEELARRLKISSDQVRAWRDGQILAPEHKLLAVADVLVATRTTSVAASSLS